MNALKNPYLSLLRHQEGGDRSELFAPPTAELDIFTDRISLNIDSVLKKFPIIMGMAGSGKSNLAGRLLEQILTHRIQIFLEDFGGEHLGVVEMYSDQFETLELPTDPILKAQEFVSGKRSIYIDYSKTDRKMFLEFLDAFLEEIWRLKLAMPVTSRRPTLFVFEESHNFIPEMILFTDLYSKLMGKIKETLRKYALLGRKFGCPCIFISQRPALNDKSIISQSRLGLYLKVTYPTDVKRYQELIPGSVTRHLRVALFKMVIGQMFFVMDGRVMIRRAKLKQSRDLGETPGFAEAKGWRDGQGIAENGKNGENGGTGGPENYE